MVFSSSDTKHRTRTTHEELLSLSWYQKSYQYMFDRPMWRYISPMGRFTVWMRGCQPTPQSWQLLCRHHCWNSDIIGGTQYTDRLTMPRSHPRPMFSERTKVDEHTKRCRWKVFIWHVIPISPCQGCIWVDVGYADKRRNHWGREDERVIWRLFLFICTKCSAIRRISPSRRKGSSMIQRRYITVLQYITTVVSEINPSYRRWAVI